MTSSRSANNAWRKGGAPSRSSTSLRCCTAASMFDALIHGMIIQSANDACIVLAEGLAGTEREFRDEADTACPARSASTKSTFAIPTGCPIRAPR